MNRIAFAALALALLGAAAPAPRHGEAAAADRAGNRMAAFVMITRTQNAHGAPDPLALYCSTDRRWCARLRQGASGGPWILELAEGANAPRRIEIPAPEEEWIRLQVWPRIVIEASGAAIVGVQRVDDGANPQGEWHKETLTLVRAAPAPAALVQVLEVPTWAYNGLYACPHRGDRARRFGACIDKALYTARLTLDPATQAGRPRFRFAALARTWPAHNVLERELDRQIPLRRADIRWAVDPECTYRLRIAWDAAHGEYRADGQFPRCPDYFGF